MRRVSIILILLLQCSCYANDINKAFGIGVGYPYFSLKYGITSNTSIEPRGAYDRDVVVGGLRLNHYFNPEDKTVFYISGEADYVLFQSSWVKAGNGEGYAFGCFVGTEYFIEDNFTFNFDIGPVLIGLTDTNRDISSNGVQWVLNAGLNYYFGMDSVSSISLPRSQSSPELSSEKTVEIPANKEAATQIIESERKELVRRYFKSGTKYMDKEMYDWAINEFNLVLKYDPNNKKVLDRIERCKMILSK